MKVRYLILIAWVALFASNAWAEIASGDHCDYIGRKNCYWSISDSGVLTISGSGSMGSNGSNKNNRPWKQYLSSVKKVIIKDGITDIGEDAFYSASNLTSITIPNSVTEIKGHAFERTGIQSITIPDSVTKINVQAFEKATNLTSVNFAGNSQITNIGWLEFAYTGLTSIVIPDSVKTLSAGAFIRCNDLQSIVIGDGVEKMDGFRYVSFGGNGGGGNSIPSQTKIYCEDKVPGRCSQLLTDNKGGSYVDQLVLFEKDGNFYRVKDQEGNYTYFTSVDLMASGKSCQDKSECERIFVESNRQSATNYTASEAASIATENGDNTISFYIR